MTSPSATTATTWCWRRAATSASSPSRARLSALWDARYVPPGHAYAVNELMCVTVPSGALHVPAVLWVVAELSVRREEWEVVLRGLLESCLGKREAETVRAASRHCMFVHLKYIFILQCVVLMSVSLC